MPTPFSPSQTVRRLTLYEPTTDGSTNQVVDDIENHKRLAIGVGVGVGVGVPVLAVLAVTIL